ncbi:MAG: hypothetical protein WA761_02500 [Thermoplasmata archaeon]
MIGEAPGPPSKRLRRVHPRSTHRDGDLACTIQGLADLRALVTEQSGVADGLVLLHDPPFQVLQEEVERLRQRLLQHHPRSVEWILRELETAGGDRAASRRIRSEHERFTSSLGQLDWLLSIVRENDHGGNRQALGQYWRILLGSIVPHVEEETRLVEGHSREPL